MNARYFIACSDSMAERDRVLLKSLLNIVGQHGATAWALSESANADVLVVDADTPAGRAALARPAPGRVVVACSAGPEQGAAYRLPKPQRAREFMQLLADIEAGLERGLDVPLLPEPAPAEPDVRALDRLLDILRQRPAGTFALAVDGLCLGVDAGKKRVLVPAAYAPADFLQKAFFGIEVLDGPGQGDFTESRSLTDFLYELSLADRPVRLARGLPYEAPYALTRWPGLTQSGNGPWFLKAATYFTKTRSSLWDAARDLGVDLDRIVAFINAAHGQGLVVVGAEPAAGTAAAVSGFRQPAAVPRT